MLNHYEGWSERELLALRKSLQGQTVNGQITRWTSEGLTVEKSALTGGVSRTTQLRRIQYSLWLIGEANYLVDTNATRYQNPYTSAIKRTRTTYV